MVSATDIAFQSALDPDDASTFDLGSVLPEVKGLGGLLDIEYDWDRVEVPSSLKEFEKRWSTRRHPLDFSGVWRFRELLPFAPPEQIVTIGEGQTILQQNDYSGRYAGMDSGQLYLQYEGMNPSGSFKDNGMTAASTHARMVGAKFAACASTGNTSASLAIYASVSRLFKTIVFVGSGKIALGKLAQALDYDAKTIQILGDFDDALKQVRAVCQEGSIYLCNSVNPFRLEGQKAIMYRVLEGLGWEVPDWIVVPGGNLGNSSAFGKAFMELKQLGLIDRVPRLAVINAEGSNTLNRLWQQGLRWNDGRPDENLIGQFYGEMDAEDRRAYTLATAIQIGRPVNLYKCLRALEVCDGLVTEVTDQEILDAKAIIGAGGFGCEPASAASVAGVKRLRREGTIAPSDRVVCILTGHELKDPDATVAYHSSDAEKFATQSKFSNVTEFPHANAPTQVENDFGKIMQLIDAL
ncbi:threonine synthase [Stratiformator vulcanicus]|uniref:Threonine synthase n=1 Tax=Stratiformator vulcanicus TaxID=2527980 RepID=A0A517R4Q2_9PLAN|nr:threonine synthase [Stratiformator vulcanicus]QDT38830.1 Threonine synthase [Stratiformator vulcanicus]